MAGDASQEAGVAVLDLPGQWRRCRLQLLAQNSPSHYFALNMLVAAGVQPGEVEFVFAGDAFEAAAVFEARKDVAACVSWAPKIYELEEKPGNSMLVTTATANRLIADVWYARADFARDHGDKIEALVRGIFDAMQELKDEAKQKECAQLMAKVYNIPAEETEGMFLDAYATRIEARADEIVAMAATGFEIGTKSRRRFTDLW